MISLQTVLATLVFAYHKEQRKCECSSNYIYCCWICDTAEILYGMCCL